MADGALGAAWVCVFAGGLWACVTLHRMGLSTSRVRDVLHVGAGSWALGFPWWHHGWVPVAIATAGFAALALIPSLASTAPWLDRIRRGVSDGDERWSGLTLYAFSAAALTVLAMRGHLLAATAGLWALAIGDGIGGAVGKQFGRHRFQLGWAKPKSVEGTLAVAALCTIAIALAQLFLGVRVPLQAIAIASLVGAVAEAVAPRASDNVLVPAVVAAVLWAAGG